MLDAQIGFDTDGHVAVALDELVPDRVVLIDDHIALGRGLGSEAERVLDHTGRAGEGEHRQLDLRQLVVGGRAQRARRIGRLILHEGGDLELAQSTLSRLSAAPATADTETTPAMAHAAIAARYLTFSSPGIAASLPNALQMLRLPIAAATSARTLLGRVRADQASLSCR